MSDSIVADGDCSHYYAILATLKTFFNFLHSEPDLLITVFFV